MIKEKSAVPKEQEVKNRQKYGEKRFDVISDAFRTTFFAGAAYCSFNIIKYLRRFVSQSDKANNIMDLYKCRDYLTRMIVEAEKNTSIKKIEVVDKKYVELKEK